MSLTKNPFKGVGITGGKMAGVPMPGDDATRPVAAIEKCPRAAGSPLIDAAAIAEASGLAQVLLKDERTRMGLGSFKALGAAYVIAERVASGITGQTYVSASAGNHGLSIAAGAKAFGEKAVIYIADNVPDAFAARLAKEGASVVREGKNYAQSMAAALAAAEVQGWTLLSDSSWDGYTALPHQLMEGYLVLAHEIVSVVEQAPTHIFLQAGVGGMAGALAAYFRKSWGVTPVIVVVEPEAAPGLHDSIVAGSPIFADGPQSNMGRLDCKEPSLIALAGLSRDADYFMTISDTVALAAVEVLDVLDIETTPSGAAGLAGLLSKPEIGLNADARVLAIISEGLS